MVDENGPVRTKRRMYELLLAGAFGNRTEQFMALADWEGSGAKARYPLWGVRSLTPSSAGMRMDVPTAEVGAFVRANHPGGCNISPMVDRWSVFRAEVFDDRTGLRVYGTFDRTLKWRPSMSAHGREYGPAAGRAVLRSVMTPSSYADLEALVERFPSHVVELTVCDRCVGVVPGRNAVVWEVRCATGEYEAPAWGGR